MTNIHFGSWKTGYWEFIEGILLFRKLGKNWWLFLFLGGSFVWIVAQVEKVMFMCLSWPRFIKSRCETNSAARNRNCELLGYISFCMLLGNCLA